MTPWMLRLLVVVAALVATASPTTTAQPARGGPLTFSFAETAKAAGLTAITVYGGTETNKYLLETTGCGVAVLDIDGDGWLDLFIVNGTVLGGFPAGQAPMGHLYRNRRDGTYEDVTAKSGIVADRMGAGGVQRRLRQRRPRRSVRDRTGDRTTCITAAAMARSSTCPAAAGLITKKPRWGAGCAFLDYDRDGYLDLFAANYIDFDLAIGARCPSRACAATRAFPSRAGRPD